MKFLLNFKDENEFQGYIALLRKEGKIVQFYVKDDKIHEYYGDNQIHTIQMIDFSTVEKLKTTDNWILSFKITGCDNTYNNYGSSVIATNSDPFTVNGFQLYSSKESGYYRITTKSGVNTNIPYNAKVVEVEFTYKNGKLYVYLNDGTNIYGSKGGLSDKFFTFNFTNDVNILSYAMPTNMNITDLKLQIL